MARENKYTSMTEADYGYVERKYSGRKKHSGFFGFAIFLIFIIALFLLIFPSIPHAISAYSGETIRSRTTMAINNAVMTALSETVTYTELVKVDKDKNGAVTLISANAAQINALVRKVVDEVDARLAAISDAGVKMPLGNLTGLAPLAGLGPEMHIAVRAPQTVNCELFSELVSSGINQTYHKIFMVVSADVTLLIPLANKTIPTTVQVLLAEAIIVGAVPQSYIQITKIG